ncbi:biopolymer transporter Tol [Naasia aerilata]|uniref:Biopolymer transporter Tol n=1 Tax=Naasia aerilata TaxID=1162966 RepID=A0ABM8GET0_9MICO|nr:biopolymer transporter Tol [Naasia aerilata]BDZ46828.1 hypothetical protein GCM10025866_27370 [Naasia aerilata]
MPDTTPPHDEGPLTTPDGRYIVVRGRLWRTANPALAPEQRDALVHELMDARRTKKSVKGTEDAAAYAAARDRVDAAKHGLGERGPVWWTDGAPDYNRKLAKNTPYAEWFAGLDGGSDAGR